MAETLYSIRGRDLYRVNASDASTTRIGRLQRSFTNNRHVIGLTEHDDELYALVRVVDPTDFCELWKIDVADISASKVGAFQTSFGDTVGGLFSLNNILYAIGENRTPLGPLIEGIYIVNLTDVSSSRLVGSLPLAFNGYVTFVHNGAVYGIGLEPDRFGRGRALDLWSINTSTPSASTRLGGLPLGLTHAYGATSHNGVAYVMGQDSDPNSFGPNIYELWTVDVTNTSAGSKVGRIRNNLEGLASHDPDPTPDPPSTPTGLNAQAGNALVNLSWNAVTGATAYGIQRATSSSGPWTTLSDVTTNAARITGLTNGTTYYFRVRAENSGGNSAWTSPVSVTPVEPPRAPSTPTGLQGEPGDEEAVLSWNAVTGALRYGVQQRRGTSGNWTTLADARVNSVGITGLTNDQVYQFRVRAENDAGNSAWTSPVSVTPEADEVVRPPIVIVDPPIIIPPPQEPPPNPGQLMATAGFAQVSLTWVEAPRADSYNVRYRRLGDIEWTTLTEIPNEAAVISGLINGTEYEFAVRAVNVFGVSGWTLTVRATPMGHTAVPGAVQNFITIGQNGQVELNWDALPTADHYEVRYREVP